MRKLVIILVLAMVLSPMVAEAWEVSVDEDPLTDEVSILIYRPSEDTKGSRFVSDTRALAIRGGGGNMEIIVMWNEYLGSNDGVAYRFDEGEVLEDDWDMSAEQNGVFVPHSLKYDFIEDMIEADRVVIGLQPHNKSRQSDIFDTTGLKEAIKGYEEELGLTL